MVGRILHWRRALVNRGLKWLEQQLLSQTKPRTAATIVGVAGDALRSCEELLLENALLRQQIVILKRRTKHVQPTNTDRRILVWLTSRSRAWREALLVVKPETILT